MKYLLAGCESQKRIDLLLNFTNIKSDNIIGALSDHLVRGLTEDLASIKNDIPQQNFNRALKSLEEATANHEALKELDYNHLTDVKRG